MTPSTTNTWGDEGTRVVFESTRSDPLQIVLIRALPVRTWRLRGLCARICGPHQDKSDGTFVLMRSATNPAERWASSCVKGSETMPSEAQQSAKISWAHRVLAVHLDTLAVKRRAV